MSNLSSQFTSIINIFICLSIFFSREFYDLKDFPVSQILSRCKEGKKRNLYFTSDIVKKIVQNNVDKIKVNFCIHIIILLFKRLKTMTNVVKN